MATGSEILLFYEPTSALDTIATASTDEWVAELKKTVTISIVIFDMRHAARVSDCAAYTHSGQLIEFDNTNTIFIMPKSNQAEEYVTGRFRLIFGSYGVQMAGLHFDFYFYNQLCPNVFPKREP